MHTLIVGARHVGKSTLIARVLKELGKPVMGFETKKEDDLADETLGSPIYIYGAGEAHVRTKENLVGYCKDKHPLTYSEAFDRFAPRLHAPQKDGVVVLDEIGFMESSSQRFCDAIMRLLDGDTPVIAAVKHNSTPFLDAVKQHPRCRCFFLTPQNREELFEDVLAFVKAQLKTAYWDECFREHRGETDENGGVWLSRFSDLLAPGGAVLDLGCGSGANLGWLLARGMQVTASDFSSAAIDAVRMDYPDAATACFDMTGDFPFEEGRFDAVVADLSLHYFSWADTLRIIGEIGRVLKPGGSLIARVHALRQLEAEGLTRIEENYYLSGGYPRRYFSMEDVKRLFGRWTLDAHEEKIVRFGQSKHVIVIAARKPEASVKQSD